MTERDAFVRAIAANLYDDTPRLAFADWLDEHGDHARAEFIRVQCELEPIRDKYELPRAAELHEREDELLHDHRDGWLAGMPDWPQHGYGVFTYFHRGFPDTVALPARYFLDHGRRLREAFPALRRVVLFRVNGLGRELAECEHLRGLAELELACWYSEADTDAIAHSPHFGDLRVLRVWIAGWMELDAPCCTLMSWVPKAWPGLRELCLIDPSPSGENRTGLEVATINHAAGRAVARGEAAFQPLLPLAPVVYLSYFSGRLPDGRLAFVLTDDDPFRVRLFEADGTPTDEITVSAPGGCESRTSGRTVTPNWCGGTWPARSDSRRRSSG